MSFSELSQVEVSKLMQGNKKAILLHANKNYLLSITRRGKLILTIAEESVNDQKIIEDASTNKITSITSS